MRLLGFKGEVVYAATWLWNYFAISYKLMIHVEEHEH